MPSIDFPLPAPELLEAPMSDGARLSVLRYAASRGPAPVVVVITPYRKESAMHLELLQVPVREGYEVLIADVRGIGGSTGPYHGVLSPREVQDGVELLEWTARQEFCDGRTAMIGGSYSGLNQLLIAARRPEGLRCVAPWIAPTDFYRDMWKRGGIPSHTNWGAMAFMSAQRADTRREGLRNFYGEIVGEDFDTELFHRSTPDLSAIEVPALFLGGWYDYFLRGTVRGFQHAGCPKRLVVGPWSHEPFLSDEQSGELASWLGHWLRGEGPDPTAEGANVRLSCLGSDDWEVRGDWPAADEIPWTRWRPVGAEHALPVEACLASTPPPPPSTVDTMVDTTTNSGMRLWGESATFDLTAAERPARLLGPVGLRAVLRAGDGCADVDVHARVSVVRPDGRVHPVTEGRLRASHREVDVKRSLLDQDGDVIVPWHTHTGGLPIEPGVPFTLHVEVYPVHIRLAPGERLRVGLTVVRADESTEPARIMLLPETTVSLPTTVPDSLSTIRPPFSAISAEGYGQGNSRP
ncbi:CocE/NonD family hydrolase [Actinomadura graeca]|uniref:CocE/NonD family hydrolase n=1 Tax=Actinomadura graeca TaxID=2750812 RepID=A0ABX8QXS4_9ACTN|nr:CocE/NonD family hydrolase [Actinomadura graeca]QXJ22257.1 CocE/NonD family hydrolase [Actinomadura graeca]